MIFAREKARIATLAAAIEQDRARMRMRGEIVTTAASKAAGSPLGLAACFAAGLVAAPLLRTALGATLSASRGRLGMRALAAAAVWGWQAFKRSQGTPGQSPGAAEKAALDQR